MKDLAVAAEALVAKTHICTSQRHIWRLTQLCLEVDKSTLTHDSGIISIGAAEAIIYNSETSEHPSSIEE